MAAYRIAICVTDLEVGGAERNVVELATRLDRQRFCAAVYCMAPPPREAQRSLVPPLEAAGVEVRCLGARGRRHFLWATRELQSAWLAQRPHLVQTFLFHANITGRIAGWRAGVKRVVCGIRVAERQRRWHLWVDRLTHRLVDRYVCVSQSVARFAEERGGLPSAKLTVIANGVDPARFSAAHPADLRQFGLAPGQRAISFIGRLDRQKGVLWLVETAADWLGRLPDCALLIVGDGPQRGRLERRLGSSPIAGRVHLAGWRAEVPEILASSGLLVLPSAWEGMPNAVLEAMAAGLPVVATAVEGVRELLGAGAAEQTVAYGDSQALSQRIVTIMQDPSLAARLGSENRRRAQEHFTVDRMVAAYEELWGSLLAG